MGEEMNVGEKKLSAFVFVQQLTLLQLIVLKNIDIIIIDKGTK
jgi:hypothetical protein